MADLDARLAEMGRLSALRRARAARVDMSASAVGQRLRRVSQLRALCLYLGRMSEPPRSTGATRSGR
jgi:hypothetical protein